MMLLSPKLTFRLCRVARDARLHPKLCTQLRVSGPGYNERALASAAVASGVQRVPPARGTGGQVYFGQANEL